MMLLLVLSGLASMAVSLPGMADIHGRADIHDRALPLSQNEGNSGPIDSLVFNAAEQFVDVRPGSPHQFIAPKAGDKRGLCPGLNAAANHGFLPRSGITTIAASVTGLAQAYGLGNDLAAVLSAAAVALTGDPTSGTWSIGGSYVPALLGNLLSNPSGISYSHNKYESDASPGRADAYLNGGDAVSLQIDRFDDIYNRAANLRLDNLRDHNKKVHDFSVQNNPYFFQAPFAGLVPPAAHHFIVNLMSNHSADNKNGFLTREVLKSFFAVTGADGAHVWNKGQEKIPLNWYRRPASNPYDATVAFADVAILAAKYPDVVRVGGNTGTANSFVGVNPGDLTGGVYTSANLLQGNNLECFTFQALQQGLPSVLSDIYKNIGPAVALVNQYVSPILSGLGCPALTTFNQSLFNQYPGYNYHPRA
ncbi:sister chromatid cohesion protein pds5 [Physcia stellaris]|nr:sister chromatid cohesion protein pds5 [Physcia stellaris]